MLTIKHPITGGEVEVAIRDFPNEMTWGKAIRECSALGGGWRLPTKEELREMYEQLYKKGQGNFTHNIYWSSSEASDSRAFHFSFGNSSVYSGDKLLTYYVRAVRAF